MIESCESKSSSVLLLPFPVYNILQYVLILFVKGARIDLH